MTLVWPLPSLRVAQDKDINGRVTFYNKSHSLMPVGKMLKTQIYSKVLEKKFCGSFVNLLAREQLCNSQSIRLIGEAHFF